MAINQHHTIEELEGVRCSIVAKNISSQRLAFLTEILTSSGLTPIAKQTSETEYTVGVTDITFNAIHALYARQLVSKNGKLVTPSYWTQQMPNEGFYWEHRQ